VFLSLSILERFLGGGGGLAKKTKQFAVEGGEIGEDAQKQSDVKLIQRVWFI